MTSAVVAHECFAALAAGSGMPMRIQADCRTAAVHGRARNKAVLSEAAGAARNNCNSAKTLARTMRRAHRRCTQATVHTTAVLHFVYVPLQCTRPHTITAVLHRHIQIHMPYFHVLHLDRKTRHVSTLGGRQTMQHARSVVERSASDPVGLPTHSRLAMQPGMSKRACSHRCK